MSESLSQSGATALDLEFMATDVVAQANSRGFVGGYRTLRRLGAQRVPTQRVPIVFAPETARSLISSVTGRAMRGNLFEKDAAGNEAAGGWFTAHCDGGSRGNPGPAGYGAVIEDTKGRVVARLSEYLGRQTNNYAEYKGLLAVLEWALKHGVRRLRVVSDSELMVRQMKGRYKVKNPGLRPLWEEAQRRALKLEGFEMRHTLRGGNKEADRLANRAMDRGMGKPASRQDSASAS